MKNYLIQIGVLYLYEIVDDFELRVGKDDYKAKKFTDFKQASSCADYFGGEVLEIE